MRLVSKDLQLWRLRERAVETGPGGEAVDEAWPVLHPFEPGFHQHHPLIQACLVRLARDLFRFDQTASAGPRSPL